MENIHVVESPMRYTPAAFQNEEFVELTDDEHFSVCMQYPLLGMEHAQPLCYVRKEVYERLLAACRFLPGGYRLCIWDAWRPFALQKELYDRYSAEIVKRFALEQMSEKQRSAEIAKYVSLPEENRDVPPVHTTGGAVDVTILDADGRELEMGTAFDAFTEETHTAYFETAGDTVIRDNRRLLYTAMTSAGFTNLPSEWWHYDYGDRFWGYYTDAPAMYRGVFTREELHETNGNGKE